MSFTRRACIRVAVDNAPWHPPVCTSKVIGAAVDSRSGIGSGVS